MTPLASGIQLREGSLKCDYSADDSALECFPDLESEGSVLDQPFTASELNAKKKLHQKLHQAADCGRVWLSLVELKESQKKPIYP